ncbi:MAG: HEAT repeat domain-containing protein [Rhodopirellula sp.]|nr:HEAT repeat domain-containing protein [Rhodopirellula sp.]
MSGPMQTTATPDDLQNLVAALASQDGLERQNARHALVDLGALAIPTITALATSDDDNTRWECAKTLAAIADPTSIQTLIELLEDSKSGTRWIAATGLVAIGKLVVEPLLSAIIDRAIHFTIVEGAHHVLYEFSRTEWGASLRPVYDALGQEEPAIKGPVAASQALQQWKTHR